MKRLPVESIWRYCQLLFFTISSIVALDAQTVGTNECQCLNNSTDYTDGQFADIIYVKSEPNENWVITNVVNMYLLESPDPPSLPISLPDNTVIPEVLPGAYKITIKRKNDTAWAATVSNGIKSINIQSIHHCIYDVPQLVVDSLVCMNKTLNYNFTTNNENYNNIYWVVSDGGTIVGDNTQTSVQITWGNEPGNQYVGLWADVYPSMSNFGTTCHFDLTQKVEIVDEIQCLLLPLEIVSFDAIAEDTKNRIEWITASEEDISEFVIQKSLDAEHWQSIGKISAKNKKEGSTYLWYDDDILNSLIYYRLKIEDFEGEVLYSQIVKLTRDSDIDYLKMHPNPTSGKLFLETNLDINQGIQYNVTSINGEPLKSGFLFNNYLDISELPDAIYTISFMINNEYVTRKIIKIK
ncbi:MAG: T9SS type A sorting domain-containing protein [Lewinellaceae bacterium]|nr:T9SS type A sorting domain-containing protein [Lewinellaceae bacterium]